MNAQVSSRNGETRKAQPDAARTGRHARPVPSSASATPDIYRNRSQDRIRIADRTLRDAYARVRAAGADSDIVSTAFGIARDALTEAHQIVHEARKELIVVHHEYDELSRRLENLNRSRYHPATAAPMVPDAPGLSLCPDPGTARTPAEFMRALRTYRTWAGEPSYRRMENVIRNQCSRHYANSTLHAALTGSELPALPLVQAVVVACGGSDAHRQLFTSAWRRLTLAQADDAD
jgi:hypothetical protein